VSAFRPRALDNAAALKQKSRASRERFAAIESLEFLQVLRCGHSAGRFSFAAPSMEEAERKEEGLKSPACRATSNIHFGSET
jgi:hypothetical protein